MIRTSALKCTINVVLLHGCDPVARAARARRTGDGGGDRAGVVDDAVGGVAAAQDPVAGGRGDPARTRRPPVAAHGRRSGARRPRRRRRGRPGPCGGGDERLPRFAARAGAGGAVPVRRRAAAARTAGRARRQWGGRAGARRGPARRRGAHPARRLRRGADASRRAGPGLVLAAGDGRTVDARTHRPHPAARPSARRTGCGPPGPVGGREVDQCARRVPRRRRADVGGRRDRCAAACGDAHQRLPGDRGTRRRRSRRGPAGPPCGDEPHGGAAAARRGAGGPRSTNWPGGRQPTTFPRWPRCCRRSGTSRHGCGTDPRQHEGPHRAGLRR